MSEQKQKYTSYIHPDDTKKMKDNQLTMPVIEGEEYAPSLTSAIDWKKVRDERVPPVAEDDPALAKVRAQLRWLAKHTTPEGNDPLSGRPWAELRAEFHQNLLDEIERYRWRKAGFEPTREMLDACRDKTLEE